MVFDDDAARGSAIPTPSEGMLTYNKDTDQLELYDGSAFGPVGSDSGLIHIETRTVTASASESFNNVFSATYDNYLIKIVGIVSAGTLFMRLRASGTDNTTASSYVFQRLIANNTTISGERGTDNFWNFCTFGTSTKNGASVNLYDPFLAQATAFDNTHSGSTNTAQAHLHTGNHNQTVSYDGFTVFPNTGNMTVRFSIYGYAKA
jgi:hypothetical protein